MQEHRLSLPERIRRLAKRVGAGMALGALVLWMMPFSRGWSDALFAVGLIGVATAWAAASGGRFDTDSGGDAGADWFDVDSSSDDGGSDGGGDGGD